MNTKKLVVFGYGARGRIYSAFAQKYPEKFELVAIIENDPERVKQAKVIFENVPVYTDYRIFLADKVEADIVAIATQDDQHREHAIEMMGAGYDLLLEKPIANKKEDCEAIYKVSKQLGKKVIVCHVLRYSPFYSTLKRIIDDGKIGKVMSIHASENVGYYHYVHSYNRGPWRNKEQSSPMILAKCCHDMDILRYLVGEECIAVSSFGNLLYFNEENAPDGCSKYCSECKYEDCIYKAQKLYLDEKSRWCASYFAPIDASDEEILHLLKHSQYDKCVFKNDNNVVDHQVTVMQFKNGATACHTMSAFSKEIYRDIKILATRAEVVGVMEDNKIEIRHFGGKVETVDVDVSSADVGGHNGSDYFMMCSLYNELNGEPAEGITYLEASVESHLMCFAAEESRLNGSAAVKIKNMDIN